MTKSKFAGVADTLFIPLEARIYVSKRFSDFFYDSKSLELEQYIPDRRIERQATEYQHFASVCRYHKLDSAVKAFLERHPHGNVICLGAGLETAYWRIGNGDAHFYEMDLPEVIEVREKVLGHGENETLIPGDLYDLTWSDGIDKKLPSLIVVSGVFQYFENEKTYELVRKLKTVFPNEAELLFDATTSKGLLYTNRFVKKMGNSSAMMFGYVDRPEEFTSATGTTLISVTGFFDDALRQLGRRLAFSTRIMMRGGELLKAVKILHLKLD